MGFQFTEEQRMFKDQVIRFAKKEIVPRVQEHDLKGEFDGQSFHKDGEIRNSGLLKDRFRGLSGIGGS